MSTQPVAELPGDVRAPSHGRGAWAGAAHAVTVLGANGFLVLIVAVYGTALLVVAARSAPPDTWLGIVAGREIFDHGLPTTDTLTVLAAGREWVDQQWLAHVLFYGAYALGGMILVVFVNAITCLLAIGGAMAAARTRGASVRAVGWVSVATMVPFLGFAVTPRAQSFVYPLFVLAALLMIDDARRPSRRLLWILPALVAWANLHGSIVLAVVLLTGHAALQLRRGRVLPGLVAVLAWASVFASPYAVELPGYYRATLAHPAFAPYITEWQATTLSPATVPFFALVAGVLYMAGRSRERLTATETWLLAVTAVAGLVTLRNIVWFAPLALLILPRLLDGSLRPRPWSERFNRLTGVAGIVVLAVAVVAVLSQRDVGRYPDEAAAAVAEAAGEDGRVYADALYANWLLGVDERLVGRVAFDVRFEILDRKTLDAILFLRLKAADLDRFARDYPVFVLHRLDDEELVEALERRGYAPRYRHDDLLVLARPRPSQA